MLTRGSAAGVGSVLLLCVLCLAKAAFAQGPPAGSPGRTQFESRCAVCHGGDGNGGEYAPGIVAQLASRNDEQLATLMKEGLPARGMPGQPNMTDPEIRELSGYLRTLRPRVRAASTGPKVKLDLVDGGTVEGTAINSPAAGELSAGHADGRVQLLRK